MLRDKMPKFYETSGTMLKLFEVEDSEISNLETALDNALNQFFLDTADTTIDRWEEEAGLPKSLLPLEQRRAAIKSKLRGYGTITVNQIKNICDAYTNGNVSVNEKPSTYEFEIKFNSVMGIPPNMNDLKAVIEQIKPAHLGVTYAYLYVTYDQLVGQFATYDALKTSGKTYDDILNGR